MKVGLFYYSTDCSPQPSFPADHTGLSLIKIQSLSIFKIQINENFKQEIIWIFYYRIELSSCLERYRQKLLSNAWKTQSLQEDLISVQDSLQILSTIIRVIPNQETALLYPKNPASGNFYYITTDFSEMELFNFEEIHFHLKTKCFRCKYCRLNWNVLSQYSALWDFSTS